MRATLFFVGFVCCFLGVEFLLVDKIELRKGVFPHSHTTELAGDVGQRRVDLPETAGYVFVSAGVVCLAYYVGLGRAKRK
jgi:hypothetical protein